MGSNDTFRTYLLDRRLAADLAILPILGATAYLLFRTSSALRPLEATLLMVAAAGLVLLGRRWLSWQHRLAPAGFLADWAQRILDGDRSGATPPRGLDAETALAAEALNTVLGEGQRVREELAQVQEALLREWRDLDGLLAEALERRAEDRELRVSAEARLETLGRDLREVVETAFHLDQLELNQRLRADQHRLHGQAFHTALEQVQGSLEHFENLQDELRSTFSLLHREEDALGRLADSGLRQGARLALAVKGLVAHTPRLLEESRARMDQLRRFRQAGDGLRDQAEALSRRIEAFRDETQRRIRTFGGAQGSLRTIDQVAQQTGLLAVNVAILAQQGGGGSGLKAIGGRLRSLAGQTAEGATELERAMDQHQQGLDRELGGLWDLQEVTQHLLSGLQAFLRMAGQLDQQGQELERALETHLGLVDQVRQASERAESSLHEVAERAAAMEAALGRQWAVEAREAPEQERLGRLGHHLSEVGEDLARASQQNIDEIWAILSRHQELRRQEVYRLVVSGGLAGLLGKNGGDGAWNRLAWARAERRGRWLSAGVEEPHPQGRLDAQGRIRLRLLACDALGRPEPSALEGWSSDAEGRTWHLRLLPALRTEDHRLSLLEVLKESPLEACLPGLELRISEAGADLHLATPYPGLPAFLAGLDLDLPVEEAWEGRFRPAARRHGPVQPFLWAGPGADPGPRRALLRLIHAWIRDDHRHESLMLWLPYEGRRPPCPWLAEGDVEERLEGGPKVRCLGLGADPASLHDLRDRLLAAGAEEGEDGAVLCVAALTHDHPEALLLRLFQTGTGLADSAHPDLVPFRSRLQLDVLGAASPDPYRAAWRLLEDLQRRGWLLPLPPA